MRLSVFKIMVLAWATFAIACGDDSTKPANKCADVTCETGVCDATTGMCVDECTINEDCAEGVCDNGTCVEDLCVDVTCGRGVCAVATGECVNATVCSNETEATDCIDGYGCYGQRCVTEAEYCETQTCDRGVCSLDAKGCVNAAACTVDSECLEGSFCENGSCSANRCDANMVMCDRGVCEGTTGDCINATTCTSGAECIDNFYCVDGACTEVDQACAACEGNQVCAYDQATTVTCQESPAGCNNTFDCLGDRVCDSGSCVAPGTCTPDALEPFDQTTPYLLDDNSGVVSAALCASDEDAFTYDVANAAQFTGTLVALVNVDAEDVGRGEVAVELLDDSGTAITSGTSVNGVARLTTTIGNLNRGVYTLVVTPSGALSSAGLSYTVFMSLLDATTAAACQTPLQLAATQTGNTLSGASLGLAPTCAGSGAPAEDVYAFDVAVASFVTLTLTPAAGVDLVLGLRTSCEVDTTEFSCVNDSAAQEQFQGLLGPGRYFAVVQAANGASGGTYTLTYASQVPVCTAADNSCADLNVAQVCNATGTGFDMVTCDLGCDAQVGRCARAESDVCYTAVDASNGYSGVIDWDVLENDFAPEAACVPGTGTTNGPDAAYFVTIPPMSVLSVELLTNGFDDMSLYLVRDCDRVQATCFAGVDALNDETLIYTNTRATAESLYVIADVESFYFDTAEITISVDPIICTPTVSMCTGAVLETCNAAGTAYAQQTCAFGCDATTNQCTVPPNDVCGPGAVDISAGGTFMVDTTPYNNDYNLPSGSCTGFSSAGRDAAFVLSGQPGDVVELTLTSSFDSSLYVLRDCADFDSCIAGDDSVGAPENVVFALADTSPVYVIVDGFGASSQGTSTLDVTISTPDCNTLGQAVTCVDATTLQYCNEFGFLTDYTCAGGCVGGACQTPTGDVCWDVIPVTAGNSYTGDFDDFTNTLDPGSSCIIDSDPAQDGPDAIYAITLNPAETLIATLTTTSTNAGMYVLSSCDETACEYGVGRSKNLEFFTATGGTYYLVVDSNSSFDTASFTLSVATRVGDVCQPGGATCDAAGVLTICNDTGSGILGTIQCPNGCNAGFCSVTAAPNDTCASAMPISSDIRLRGSFGTLTADYNPLATGCTASAAPGPDAVYAITLGPGEVVEATVQSLASGRPSIYFVTDCSDVTTTCVAGEVASIDELTTGYYSAAGETIYMVVDNSLATTGDYLLDITFKPSECTPGSAICSGPDTLAQCSPYGLYVESSCYFGCANGACNPAPNDLCTGAIDVGAGGTFMGDIGEYANDYDPTSAGCTGWAEVGPDAAYSITPTAGDIITVDVVADFDSAIYVVTDCASLSTCLVGSDDFGNDETVSFVATGATYFIIVDAFSATGTGVFTMTVSAETPFCTPGSRSCNDGTNVETCNATGTGTDVYPCNTTCTVGSDACDTGSSCANAIPILQSGTINGTYYPWQTNLSPPDVFGYCTDYEAVGPEVVYSVTLTAGQTITATVSATDTNNQDTSIYLITDCAAIGTSCVAGDDAFGTDDSLTYTSIAGGTYYVVVDNYDTVINSDPTFALTVTIQ